MPENLERWIDLFLHHLAVEKGLSPNTLEAYARDLQGYCALLREKGTLEVGKISPEQSLNYLKALRSRGLSARSQARVLSTLRGFHKFLLQERAVEENPVRRVRSPRVVPRLPSVLTPERNGGSPPAARPPPAPGGPRPGHAGTALRRRPEGLRTGSSFGK